MDKILTPDEVAEILSIGYRSVLKLLKSQQIKSFKINNQYRVTETALQVYIQEAESKW